jgi:NADPH2:quinone reductase
VPPQPTRRPTEIGALSAGLYAWPKGQVTYAGPGGEAADLPLTVLQGFIDAVRDGAAVAPVGAVYRIDQIVEAHTAMEEGRVAGKIVVLM